MTTISKEDKKSLITDKTPPSVAKAKPHHRLAVTVVPINRDDPGTWKEIKRFMWAMSGMQSVAKFDPEKFVAFMEILEAHCVPMNGATIDEVLDRASFNDMMELADTITGDKEGESNGAN